MSLLDRFRGRSTPDGYKVAKNDPLSDEHELLTALILENYSDGMDNVWGIDIGDSAVAKQIKELDREAQSRAVAALIPRLRHLDQRVEEMLARVPDGSIYPRRDKGWYRILGPRAFSIWARADGCFTRDLSDLDGASLAEARRQGAEVRPGRGQAGLRRGAEGSEEGGQGGPEDAPRPAESHRAELSADA